ncbi:MAG: molybdopterin-synthase adenylyltransferase MoeB [Armatimonadetes bacterium]|nr:molybdopterin-synthase adenylyltransferase MoeB [Armatimonadota bacterium]
MLLSSADAVRYARHLTLSEVGVAGQGKLRNASVLCVGAGGLGSPALLYLAAAGVGRIGIVDGDAVSLSNLQRQILYATNEVGAAKTNVVRENLAALNPGVTIETHPEYLTSANALALFARYDLVLDGSDNFPTRYLVSDAHVLSGVPVVQGAVNRFEGQVTVFDTRRGSPCYRCVFPVPPAPGEVPNCAEAGVLGAVVGVVGTLMATEALKYLLQIGEPLAGKLLHYDALSTSFRTFALKRNTHCAACGDAPTVIELIDYEKFCGANDAVQSERTTQTMREITPLELKAKQDAGDKFLLIDVREPYEYEIARIPGSQLIPLGEIERRADDLPDDGTEIVLQCRSGARSAQALAVLQSKGFTNLANLKGGILAWSDTVDPSVPKY